MTKPFTVIDPVSQHTPGPWYVAEKCRWNGEVRMIRTTIDTSGTVGVTGESNSHLVAAAPELLEALKECLTDPNAYAFASEDFYKAKQRILAINNIAKAAIAKASGLSAE